MAKLEFFFDCSSPWTYLAFHHIEELAAETGADLAWKPILVGGIFNAVNSSVYEQRANPVPAKLRYYAKDLKDWARHAGIRIGAPPVFPVNSVRAMRGCFLALMRGSSRQYARAIFEAYWGDLLRHLPAPRCWGRWRSASGSRPSASSRASRIRRSSGGCERRPTS